jgi:hypothetical protein
MHTRPDALPGSITTEVKMTARNGSAEGRSNVESGSGTVTVGDGEAAYCWARMPRSIPTDAASHGATR